MRRLRAPGAVSCDSARVFDRVTVTVADRDAAERFYETVLGAAGIEATRSSERVAEWDDFSLVSAGPQRPATRRLHVGFAAATRDHVNAFWRAGRAAGHPDAGAPGPRPQYRDDYYGAFLIDPDGNSAEAVHHQAVRREGNVDHLWIRVAELDASRRFFTAVMPHAGLRLHTDTPERVSFVCARTGGGTFSLVEGAPTEGMHMALRARDDDAVRAFHAAAIGAGYGDAGAPLERSEHDGRSYAAFTADPDGNTVGLVSHHRTAGDD